MKHILFMTVVSACVIGIQASAEQKTGLDSDISLESATVIVNPWRFHIPPTKRQGVPGIERTAKGRLWAVYGRDVESTRNYQVLTCSDDDGTYATFYLHRRWINHHPVRSTVEKALKQ